MQMTTSETGGGSVSSQNFLIGSLQAARDAQRALEMANKELLEALSNRQEEILRLSNAGKLSLTMYSPATHHVFACEKVQTKWISF